MCVGGEGARLILKYLDKQKKKNIFPQSCLMVMSKFATPTPMYQFHRLNYFITWQKINMEKCSFLINFFNLAYIVREFVFQDQVIMEECSPLLLLHMYAYIFGHFNS